MNKYLKIGVLMLILTIFTMSIVGASDVTSSKKITKVKEVKIKGEPMKKCKIYGSHTPKFVYMNKTHIKITGVYCTCGRYGWHKSGTRIYENRIRSVKTGKPLTKFGTIKVNPKRVPDGEFTTYVPGTPYNSIDLCLYCGKEKMPNSRYFMKRLS